MYNNPERARYHFSPAHWMNDPIPFFANGQYHIFFQHNPNGAFWGTMHWGHAVSDDLVHWRALPIALTPTPDGPDQDGCFTGCVVEDGGRFHILYTGIPRLNPLHQVQCLAGSADLVSWEKHPGNPVIADPPPGFGPCFRDPCVWKEGDTWRMVIGSEIAERGGAALHYESPDLVQWRYLGPLCVGKTDETGHEFECPDFFLLDGAHVLLTSCGKTHWQVGKSDGAGFTPERRGLTDGGSYYAAKTLLDGQGRRILWGWITETRPEAEQRAAGWSGVLSLPRVLSLRPDRTLGLEPAPELAALRARHRRLEPVTLAPDRPLLLEGVEGDALEIAVTFLPSQGATVGLLLRASPGLEESSEIAWNPRLQRLGGAPLALAADEPLTLRVFVDRSVVEAYANGRACHTLRCYPQRPDSLGVALFARGAPAQVSALDVWELEA